MTCTNENKPLRELNQQQEAFVLHFTTTPGAAGNAAEAARRAGYSQKNGAEIGRQLLGKPHIQAAIDAELRDAIGSRLTVLAVMTIDSPRGKYSWTAQGWVPAQP